MSTVAAFAVQWAGRLPGPTYEPTGDGSPGIEGFVATFLLAAAIILLAVSFTRRMRRATYRERQRAATSAQAQETAASPGSDADGRADADVPAPGTSAAGAEAAAEGGTGSTAPAPGDASGPADDQR